MRWLLLVLLLVAFGCDEVDDALDQLTPPLSLTLSPEGGSYEVPGLVTLTVPPGAVTEPVEVSVRPMLDPAGNGWPLFPDWVDDLPAVALELRPHGLTFQHPIVLSFPPVAESLGLTALHAADVTSDWDALSIDMSDDGWIDVSIEHFSVVTLSRIKPGACPIFTAEEWRSHLNQAKLEGYAVSCELVRQTKRDTIKIEEGLREDDCFDRQGQNGIQLSGFWTSVVPAPAGVVQFRSLAAALDAPLEGRVGKNCRDESGFNGAILHLDVFEMYWDAVDSVLRCTGRDPSGDSAFTFQLDRKLTGPGRGAINENPVTHTPQYSGPFISGWDTRIDTGGSWSLVALEGDHRTTIDRDSAKVRFPWLDSTSGGADVRLRYEAGQDVLNNAYRACRGIAQTVKPSGRILINVWDGAYPQPAFAAPAPQPTIILRDRVSGDRFELRGAPDRKRYLPIEVERTEGQRFAFEVVEQPWDRHCTVGASGAGTLGLADVEVTLSCYQREDACHVYCARQADPAGCKARCPPRPPSDCDGLDSDGDGVIDNNADRDGDGVPFCGADHRSGTPDDDCDDDDAARAPGKPELCDGIDNDCNGATRADLDGDGHVCPMEGGDDCNDGDAMIHPGAAEVCDGVDNDCNPATFTDADGDGFACSADLADRTRGGDCNDSDRAVNPAAIERCGDAVDSDCDGAVNSGNQPMVGRDEDCDGHAAIDSGGDDCDDHDATVHPGSPYIDLCWDGVDTRCDGTPHSETDRNAEGMPLACAALIDPEDTCPTVFDDSGYVDRLVLFAEAHDTASGLARYGNERGWKADLLAHDRRGAAIPNYETLEVTEDLGRPPPGVCREGEESCLTWAIYRAFYFHPGLTPEQIAARQVSTKVVDVHLHAVVGYDPLEGFYGEVLCRVKMAERGVPDLHFKMCETYNLREQRELDAEGAPVPHRVPLTYSQAMACRKRMLNAALNYGFGGDTDLPAAW